MKMITSHLLPRPCQEASGHQSCRWWGEVAWNGEGTPYLYLVGGSTTLSNILGLKNIYNDGKKMYSKYLAKDLKTWAKLSCEVGNIYMADFKKGWLYVIPQR